MARRTITVRGIGAALLGGMLILIVGYWLLEHVLLGGTHRVEAVYPGMIVRGVEAELGWDWEYDQIVVTSPSQADFEVQCGSQPAMHIEDVTSGLVERYENQDLMLGGTTVAPEGEEYLDQGYISFHNGVITEADVRHRHEVWFIRAGKKFKLPVLKREFDRIFGRPISIRRREFWL